MPKHLYILCESRLDQEFYLRLASRITGLEFELNQEFPLRPGSSFDTAMAHARLLIKTRFKYFTSKQDIAFIVAVDNDRSPGHPHVHSYPRILPKSDLKKEPRYPQLMRMLYDDLGQNRAEWSVDVALAVPVEMIESWVLMLLDPNRDELPPFSDADSPIARNYYNGKPPAQLKDLCLMELKKRDCRKNELFRIASEADLEAVSEVVPSLRLFVDELKAWN
jgi:hypothetical protein